MKKNTSNKSYKKFLKKGISDVTQLHKEYLGTDIPADYFENSKLSILNKINSETSTGKFLKEEKSDITKHHKNYLGKEIPEDYFKKSKSSILNAIKEDALVEQKPKKQLVFYLRPQFKFIAAAAILFLLTLSIWLQNSESKNNFDDITIEELALEDDVLIKSLLVEDSDLDEFTDATLFNEVVVKAEIKEQKMDDLILNSLILEDSLLDNYMDEELVETIIL
ncbi:hypothetical protein [Polaribacter marinivivus]|uniref:Uncharacterized protein n=1 Tax=Polaribacter marinivivus TaxID=1524260 RepID=A0ABV8R847_9FLAO